MITKDREYRSFDFTIDEMNVEGTPVVFEKPTLMYEIDGVKFYEVIDREAFDGAKIDDVVLNVDHSGKPAAKTKNGTLDIRVGMNGVHIKADLSKNATGRELFEDIKNGFFEKMSFAFTIREESYDVKSRTRRILKIDRLFDVSAVTFAAYNQTSIFARDTFSMEFEKERLEKRLREEKQKQLLLKLKIMEVCE